MKKLKKILITLAVLLNFSIIGGAIVHSEDIERKKEYEEYHSKIENCLNASPSKTLIISNTEGYECGIVEQNTDELVAFQVAFDLVFKEIQEDIEREILGIQDYTLNHTLEKVGVYREMFDKTSENHTYYKRYEEACNFKIQDIVQDYFKILNTNNSVSSFYPGASQCMGVAQTQMNAYQEAVQIIILKNEALNNINIKNKFIYDFRQEFTRVLNLCLIYVTTLMELVDKVDYILPITRGGHE